MNEPILLGYAYSNLAVEIDKDIRETIKRGRVSILAIGLGLAKINEKGLYLDLNCSSMSQYVGKLCDDTKISRSTIFNWLSIGETYIKYKDELEKISYNDSDGPTKLPFIERALKTKQKQDVFRNIKKMSVRDFKTWVSVTL